jgi:hypothetical protein
MLKKFFKKDKNTMEEINQNSESFQIKELLKTTKEINKLFTKEGKLSEEEYKSAIEKQEKAKMIYDNLSGK